MTPINVHNEFDFTSSCTGCCSKPKDTEPLYVNKNLEIEPWSRRKSNKHSFERNSSRVNLLIKNKIPHIGVDKDIAFELVTNKLQLELDKRPITKKDLAAIIHAIGEINDATSPR